MLRTNNVSHQQYKKCVCNKFYKQQLTNADFSQYDLRGVTFYKSVLVDANFSGAKLGIPRHKFLLFYIIIVFISATLALVLLNVALLVINQSGSLESQIVIYRFISISVIIAFSITSFFRGEGLATGVATGIAVLMVILTFIVSIFYNYFDDNFVAESVLAATLGAAICSIITFESVILTVSVFLGKKSTTLYIIGSSLVMSLEAMSLNADLAELSLIFFILSTVFFMAYRIMKGAVDGLEIFRWIYLVSLYISSLWGTRFIASDISNANFTNTDLSQSSFQGCKAQNTKWRNSVNVSRALINISYMRTRKLTNLIVAGNGYGSEFINLDLTGANLEEADLRNCNLTGSNLNYVNFKKADLSLSLLKQTKLEGTNFDGAKLTGAYIEDWGITQTTSLNNIVCKYVFMRVPTQDNPNPIRKPDNLQETFHVGEFSDFIRPYFNTLDLYHSQKVDPRAISIAFKKLDQNNPEANLEIVAMEKRGKDSLNIRVSTEDLADKSKLSLEYFNSYNRLKSLSDIQLRLLEEKDDRIRSLEQMIQTALRQPRFNIETIQGGFMSEDKGININAGNNANISGVSSGDGITSVGIVSGNVTNSISKLPDSDLRDSISMKEILSQLQEAVESDPNLSTDDKIDLLEEVQALAEANQIEDVKKKEGVIRKARKIFDSTLKSLPDTAKLVEACSKLLPLIFKFISRS